MIALFALANSGHDRNGYYDPEGGTPGNPRKKPE
jgi:hypothetical protein